MRLMDDNLYIRLNQVCDSAICNSAICNSAICDSATINKPDESFNTWTIDYRLWTIDQ